MFLGILVGGQGIEPFKALAALLRHQSRSASPVPRCLQGLCLWARPFFGCADLVSNHTINCTSSQSVNFRFLPSVAGVAMFDTLVIPDQLRLRTPS